MQYSLHACAMCTLNARYPRMQLVYPDYGSLLKRLKWQYWAFQVGQIAG